MYRRRLREESGYTLVEVMVSIVLLAVAILPMFGMFDMALNATTQSSHYDKARTLANLKMEEAKSLPFVDVKDNFPVNGSTPDTATGYYDSGFIPESGPASAEFTNFEYRVEKQYMQQPPTGIGDDPIDPTEEFDDTCEPCDPPTGLIRVTVTVQWDDKSFTTYGLVAE